MTQFFDTRTIVRPGDLRGPRVYSTDLLPELFDVGDVEASLRTTARALKIKMLTKGVVTLNGAYLVSPQGLLLRERYPDLLSTELIVPAVLSDRDGLAGFIPGDLSSYGAVGLREEQVADAVAGVETGIRRVMPWDVSMAAEGFRATLLDGLMDERSPVSARLSGTGVYDPEMRTALREAIRDVDLSRSENLRQRLGELPKPLRAIMLRYAASCYHLVGTSVVRCEAGADLSPLSHFRAADLVLASRDAGPEQLSEETIFLRYFLAEALAAIQVAYVFPSEFIDALSPDVVVRASAALREQGFQHDYETVLSEFARDGSPSEVLEGIDVDAVVDAGARLHRHFRDAIEGELSVYRTKEYDLNRDEFVRASTDVLMEGVSASPAGNLIAVTNVVKGAVKAMGSFENMQRTSSHAVAVEAASARKKEEIERILSGLPLSSGSRARLLKGIAALADVRTVSTRRA